MSIKEQLQRLRERSLCTRRKSSQILSDSNEPDFIFYDEVQEAGKAFKEQHQLCYAANKKYFDYFLSEKSKSFRRERLAEEENEIISKRVRHFISVITPYADHNYTKKIVQWLLRRYHIDKHEFSSLLSLFLVNQSKFESFALTLCKAAVKRGDLLKRILEYGYSIEAVGRVIGEDIEISGCIIDSIKHAQADEEGMRHYLFYEKVIEKMVEKELFKEETLALWVASMLQIRESRIVSKEKTQIDRSMILSLERSLTLIAWSTDLVDVYAEKIAMFYKNDLICRGCQSAKRHSGICACRSGACRTEICKDEEKPEALPEKEESSSRKDTFIALYEEYKRTGKYERITTEYRVEFIKHLISDIRADGLIGTNRSTVRDALVETLKSEPKRVLSLFAESSELLQIVYESEESDSLVKMHPQIEAMRLLDQMSPKVFTKKILSAIYFYLPNRNVERKIFKCALSNTEIKGAVRTAISLASSTVLAEEVQKIRKWNILVLFIQQDILPFVVDGMAPDIIAPFFGEYIEITKGFSAYTKISHIFSNEQKETVLEKVKKYMEKTPNNMCEILHSIALIDDFSLDRAHLFSLLSTSLNMPKKERKTAVKFIFEVLLNRKDSVIDAKKLFQAIEMLSPAEIDYSISFLLFKILSTRKILSFSKEFILSVISMKETPMKIVVKNLLQKKQQDVIDLFVKYSDTLMDEEVLLLLNYPDTRIIAPIVSSRFMHLSKYAKECVINTALEQKESGKDSLFLTILSVVPIDLLLETVKNGPASGISAVLDLLEGKEVFSESAALKCLLAAKQLSFSQDQLTHWENMLISRRQAPQLLMEVLAKEEGTEFVCNLIFKYLQKGYPSTPLLEEAIKRNVYNSNVIMQILEYKPSTRVITALLKKLVSRKKMDSLQIIYSILKNKKSSNIRYFVQYKLPEIASLAFKAEKKLPGISSAIIANLLQREEDVMSPYIADIIQLVKTGKRKVLIHSMALLEARYVIPMLSEKKEDSTILIKYIESRSKKNKLEEKEVEMAIRYYISHLPMNTSAHGLVRLFPHIKSPQQVWNAVIEKFGGISATFLSAAEYMVRRKGSKHCIVSLSIIYSALESILLENLKKPVKESLDTICEVLSKYYTYEKNTLISTMDILSLSIPLIDTYPSVTKVIVSLFRSRIRNNSSEAESMNSSLLKFLVEKKSPNMFKIMCLIYRKCYSSMGRVFNQSIPYFSLLLESKDPETRKNADDLMLEVEKATGMNPYNHF